MSSIFVKAPAKVNLYLDVIGKDPVDDYHLISTIIARVANLCDEITIEPLDGHFQILVEIDPSSKYSAPDGEDNICFKAANLLKQEAIESGIFMDLEKKLTAIKIILKKNIPVQAGCGGGSSDAAAVIKALNKLWNLNFPPKKLKDIAAKISMDSAFFIEGSKYAYCTHFGEIIEPLESEIKLNIEIIDTGVEVETASAYRNIDLTKCRQNKNKARTMVGALIDGDREAVMANLHNDFEYLISEKYHELYKQILELRSQTTSSDNDDTESDKKIILCGSGGCIAVIS